MRLPSFVLPDFLIYFWLQVVVVIPEVPGFAGNVKDESSVQVIMAAQYRTINRGGASIYEELRKANIEP